MGGDVSWEGSDRRGGGGLYVTVTVESWQHSSAVTFHLSDYDDVSLRRQSLIGQINTVLCRFGRLDPTVTNRFIMLTALVITVLNYGIWIVIKSRSTAGLGGRV